MKRQRNLRNSSFPSELKLELLLRQDAKLDEIELDHLNRDLDPEHVLRRQCQRSITDSMIKLALIYGAKKRSLGAWSYTITDRSLAGTLYSRFIDKLRGLTIVGFHYETKFVVITCFWKDKIIKRKRY